MLFRFSSKITLLTNDNTILFQPCSTVKLASVSYLHETLPAWDVYTTKSNQVKSNIFLKLNFTKLINLNELQNLCTKEEELFQMLLNRKFFEI